jgi:hypothetical protein
VHGPKIFEYKMEQTDGVNKDSAWTPEEIKERFNEITK